MFGILFEARECDGYGDTVQEQSQDVLQMAEAIRWDVPEFDGTKSATAQVTAGAHAGGDAAIPAASKEASVRPGSIFRQPGRVRNTYRLPTGKSPPSALTASYRRCVTYV